MKSENHRHGIGRIWARQSAVDSIGAKAGYFAVQIKGLNSEFVDL